MKSLVLWSSGTGNTKKVAQAIYENIPGEKEIAATASLKNPPEGYDILYVGFWAFRRGADPVTRRFLSSLHNQKVALFGTCGAWPDSDAARRYLSNTAALLAPDNTCLGTWICQGRVHSFHIKREDARSRRVHPMTEERKARLTEAEKHPDASDLEQAAAWARSVQKKLNV